MTPEPEKCKACSGDGKYMDTGYNGFTQYFTYPICHGTGKADTPDTCPECGRRDNSVPCSTCNPVDPAPTQEKPEQCYRCGCAPCTCGDEFTQEKPYDPRDPKVKDEVSEFMANHEHDYRCAVCGSAPTPPTDIEEILQPLMLAWTANEHGKYDQGFYLTAVARIEQLKEDSYKRGYHEASKDHTDRIDFLLQQARLDAVREAFNELQTVPKDSIYGTMSEIEERLKGDTNANQ